MVMKVLVVDDEEKSLDLFQDFLTNHQIVTATDGKEALEKFHQDTFDVVLTDYAMPIMSGIELLKAIRDIAPELPVIIMTGYADKESAINAVNNGAFAYFEKPIEIDDIADILQQIENQNMARKRFEQDHAEMSRELKHLRVAYKNLLSQVALKASESPESPESVAPKVSIETPKKDDA